MKAPEQQRETNGTIKKDEQEEMWYKQNKLI